MRQNKLNKSLLFGIALLVLMSFSVMAATVSIIVPADSSTITGVNVFNVTNVTAFDTMVNCTIYLKSASTANSSWTSVGTFSNNSLINVNGTFNSSTFEDSNDYVINATCRNSSNDQAFDTNTGITIANTVPVAPSALTPVTETVVSTAGTQTFSSTVTDTRTTGCTYVINRGGSSADSKSASGTATYSGSTCSFTKAFSDTGDDGTYTWTITASDGTDTVSSAGNQLIVSLPSESGGLPSGQYTTNDQGQIISTSTETTDNNWLIPTIIFGVVALVVILYIRRR